MMTFRKPGGRTGADGVRSGGSPHAPVLIYEASHGGHRAEFLLWLVEAWERRGETRALIVVAPPQVLDQRPELKARLSGQPLVQFHPLDYRSDSGSSIRNAVALDRFVPLRAALKDHQPCRVLAMSFEHLVAGLAARIPLPGPARLAALSLRPVVPTNGQGYGAVLASGMRNRLVTRALRHRQLDVLLSLDPDAVTPIRRQAPGLTVRAVPDPVPPGTVVKSAAEVRATYGVPEGRRLLLLPGALERRKGAVLLAEALLHVPPSEASRLSVLMAGVIEPGLEEEVRNWVAQVRTNTNVHLVLDERYVATDDLPSVIAAADLVVLPYVQHVGSSGFQLRAAACGVPSLVPSDGLMGRLAQAHGLGPTLSAVTPEALAASMVDALQEASSFDSERAMRFAASRTVEAFADAILGPLQLAHPDSLPAL